MDDYHQMYGAIEIKSIEQVISADTGWITIIEPHAYVETLGMSFSPIAVILDIFDTALNIFMLAATAGIANGALTGIKTARAVEGAGLFDAAGAVLVEAGKGLAEKTIAWKMAIQKTAGSEVATLATKKALEDSTGAAARKAITKVFDTNKSEIEQAVTSYYSKLGGVAEDPIAGLVADCKASKPAINTISDLSAEDIQISINKATSVSGGGISGDGANALQRKFGEIATGKGSQKALAGLKGFGEAVAANPTMAAFLNPSIMTKVGLATLGATAWYFHVFAGKDDDHYACPLNITPLSYRGQPYVAGLEGLTHQSGVWSLIEGQLYRFWGSAQITASWGSEWIDTMKAFKEAT
jgi:hypothetical protein